ncbi:hypothetical protein D915_000408 [Fasciola hepatica]|uniref:Uncharacterized protein n=1 Tax=Fasciola hepatica TaxID=6192 RepID=A0A4E0RLE6_FASHE|nr:hypothetical protein D915_000408 [Fasciola hepatica]
MLSFSSFLIGWNLQYKRLDAEFEISYCKMITAKITSFVLLVVLLFSRQSLALPTDKSVDEFIKGNRMLDGMRSYGEDIDDDDNDDNDESVSIPPVSSEEDLNRKLAQNNPVADADDDNEDDEDDDAKDEIKVGTNVLQRADLPETTPIIPNPNPTGSVDDDDDDDDDDEDNEKAKAISNLLRKMPDIPTPVATQFDDDDDNAKEEASELPDNLPICELDKAEFASDKPTVLCKRKTSPTRMTVRTGDNGETVFTASSSFSSSTASNSITDDNGTSTVSASLLNLSDTDDSTENDNGKEKSILVIRHQTQPSSNCDLSDPKPQGKTIVFTNIKPTDSFTKVDSEMTCDDKCGDQINDQPPNIRNPKESDDSDDLSTNLEKLFQNDEPSEARMCTTNRRLNNSLLWHLLKSQ